MPPRHAAAAPPRRRRTTPLLRCRHYRPPPPEPPRGPYPPPRRPPLSPTLPAASSRLCRLDRAPAGRAVASSSVAATSSTPACPPFPAETPGAASPPSPFSFLRAGRLQSPLPPRPCAVRSRRLLPRPRSHLLSLGQPSVSRGKHRRRVLAGVQWRRHHLSVSGRLLFVAGTPTDVAVSSVDVAASPSTPAAPRFRRNAVAAPASPSSLSPASFRPLLPPRRLVAPLHHHLHQHRSGVFHVILVPVQPLPAVLVASSPVPVVVVLSPFPVVVAFVPPSSRSRPSSAFVKRAATTPSSFSSSAPRRQAPCRPRLAFVQRSPPKPSPRRSSPLCPSVSAAPVRRCRSHASSRGGL
ncbi:vegetative cell wall protein gp1-like [Oryza sativa Japonica Group]|uniref:vegetative cell wall protein gp1-like n=1 Tax=Oryza sativa subsp. japonica TaxID=39947 RepID=UPI00339CBF63